MDLENFEYNSEPCDEQCDDSSSWETDSDSGLEDDYCHCPAHWIGDSEEDDYNSLPEEDDGLGYGKRLVAFHYLNKEVKRRVMALKKLMLARADIKMRLQQEYQSIHYKYYEQYYVKIYDKRRDIVQGIYEPTEEECDLPEDAKEVATAAAEDGSCRSTLVADNGMEIKGIPDFWQTLLDVLFVIQPKDRMVMKYLTDIRYVPLKDCVGFSFEFYFSPNEWFTNNVLTIKYEVKPVLSIMGLVMTEGTKIQWYEGKNVTTNEQGIINSVFNMFNHDLPDEMVKEQSFEELAYHLLNIIPKAVIYYDYIMQDNILNNINTSNKDDDDNDVDNCSV